MQFNLKRTVLTYLWLLITNVNCLPGMLRSNREIASKLSCEISQQVDELLQIDKTLDNQFGILRTHDGYSLVFHNLENSYLENEVIVTVNKKRQVEFNNYLQYQEYGFEQFIIEGLNYIYTKTKFASQEGIIVHILSMYQQGQVKQQIYETQKGLQYNFKLNEQQDYFIQIIFATTINNDFIGSQLQIENIIKTLNLGQECKPNTCSNDQEFINQIQNIDFHQQNPKLISLAQYRTRQSIYNYHLVNNIYISSIQSQEIVRYLTFTDECIQIMSKQDEINNIQIEFEQYFCVANLIQSIKLTSTQFSQKQLNYLIVLQQSPDSDSEQLIDQLIQLVSSLKCMKDKKYDKLIQSQSLFLQSSSHQEIATNTVEFQQNNVQVESISFDLQQPIKEETQQVVEKSFSDDIFDQPKQLEEQQHQQRLNEVEEQLAKTQEISEPINFNKQDNTEQVEQPIASTTTTEQIIFDEYNSQNQDIVSIPTIKEENIQQSPIIQQEEQEVKSELQEQLAITPQINENETIEQEQQTKESDDYSDYHNHHHHHHHHYHHHHQHQNFIHNNHNEQEEYEYDENVQESELRTTNLRGKRNKEDIDPIIADKIVIEYNFVHQQPAKKGNVNCDKKKQDKDQEEEQVEEAVEEKEDKKPKKNCKPKKEEQEQEIEAVDDNKEEDTNEQSDDKKPKCKKKKNNKIDEEQQTDSVQGIDENESNNNEQEQQEEEQNEEPKNQKKKKCKKNKDQDQNETDNVEVDQEKEYDGNMLEDQFCRKQRSREDQYMRQLYDNGNGIEDELYWRYKHMKRQQIPYPFNGYPYKHRKQNTDHSPFPHVNSYYKKHPFSIPSTNQAPWVGRDFFPDTGYGMGRVMDAYKGRYSDPQQVLKDLAIKNKQQKQWREQVQRYREQVGYGDEYQYFDQNYYDSPFTEPQEQVYDYLNDSQYKFRQGKKPLEKPIRNSIEQREIERGYQESDCFVIYDQCHYQGRRLQLCGEYPDIPSNIQGFKIFSFIIPDNLELRFFQSSDYENNIKDVEGSEECLEVPYELIPQQ